MIQQSVRELLVETCTGKFQSSQNAMEGFECEGESGIRSTGAMHSEGDSTENSEE